MLQGNGRAELPHYVPSSIDKNGTDIDNLLASKKLELESRQEYLMKEKERLQDAVKKAQSILM